MTPVFSVEGVYAPWLENRDWVPVLRCALCRAAVETEADFAGGGFEPALCVNHAQTHALHLVSARNEYGVPWRRLGWLVVRTGAPV